MVDNWVWETGLARLGRSHLQGSSLLVASIQGRKLGWTFSAHPVKIYTQTRGRLYHASGPHPSREALPFLHGSASVSNTHSLWTFSSPCTAHYFVLTVGGCDCLHFVHKENLLPRHRITRRASGIPTPQPACLSLVFPSPHSNVLFPVVLSLDFIRVHRAGRGLCKTPGCIPSPVVEDCLASVRREGSFPALQLSPQIPDRYTINQAPPQQLGLSRYRKGTWDTTSFTLR